MSEGATTVTRMSNIEVAGLIGLSHVQVSRIRSGQRLPGYDTMVEICRVFDWSMDDQAQARTDHAYPSRFESVLERYASTRNTTGAPEERSTPGPQ